eukprot:1160079-Pelagomonas_calceolata.AAC.5
MSAAKRQGRQREDTRQQHEVTCAWRGQDASGSVQRHYETCPAMVLALLEMLGCWLAVSGHSSPRKGQASGSAVMMT